MAREIRVEYFGAFNCRTELINCGLRGCNRAACIFKLAMRDSELPMKSGQLHVKHIVIL
jgi:hypothetical protein